MPTKVKRIYLESIMERYKKSTKYKKGLILNEFCQVCGYERKYAIRILNGAIKPRFKKPGPASKYEQVIDHIYYLWNAMNRMCSKKMVKAFDDWLPFYKSATNDELALIKKISASSIDRLLKPYRGGHLKGKSTTMASLLKSKIPIKLLDAEVLEPGFIESDTVAHCGSDIAGDYANSITMTDLFSGWTENRAVWKKHADVVKKQIQKIEYDLPFMLKGFASDNGNEFLNDELHKYFTDRLRPVEFVRRRPYKKNDNAHVEQKNFTHVREIFGYVRIEDPVLIGLMNEIYQAYWNPLWNYFTPMMKLKAKTRIGSKIKKEYDKPETPFARLMATDKLDTYYKLKLKQKKNTINPFVLKDELDKKLKLFFQLVDQYKKERKPTGS
jgi:hypothetical protein